MRVPLALIMIVSSPASSEPLPKNAAAWCAQHQVERLPVGTVTWRGRLDADAAEDVIVNLGDCGTTECRYAAFVRCGGGGGYAEVFDDYAARLRVRRRSGWALLEVEHVGDRERDGSRPRSWFRVPFTANGYVEP